MLTQKRLKSIEYQFLFSGNIYDSTVNIESNTRKGWSIDIPTDHSNQLQHDSLERARKKAKAEILVQFLQT